MNHSNHLLFFWQSACPLLASYCFLALFLTRRLSAIPAWFVLLSISCHFTFDRRDSCLGRLCPCSFLRLSRLYAAFLHLEMLPFLWNECAWRREAIRDFQSTQMQPFPSHVKLTLWKYLKWKRQIPNTNTFSPIFLLCLMRKLFSYCLKCLLVFMAVLHISMLFQSCNCNNVDKEEYKLYVYDSKELVWLNSV